MERKHMWDRGPVTPPPAEPSSEPPAAAAPPPPLMAPVLKAKAQRVRKPAARKAVKAGRKK